MTLDTMTKPLLLATAMSAALATGCDDGDGRTAGPQVEPLYVMMSQVYDTSDRTIFYPTSNTLDLTGHVALAGVHQEPGVANLQTAGGKVLISSGSAPRVTRYVVDDAGEWFRDGTINFTGYGLPEDGANFYNQFVLSDTAIYLMGVGGPFGRIVWNPTSMEIVGHFVDETLPEPPADMDLNGGGNRANIRYTQRVRQIFGAAGMTNSGPTSYLVEYDATTHAESKVTPIACPGLAVATAGANGQTVYSPYPWEGLARLFADSAAAHPEPCVAIVDSAAEVDSTFTIGSITNGLVGGNVRYLRDGYALAAVLDHSDFTGTYDYDGTYEDAVLAGFEDEVWAGANWDLWLIDLDAGTGAPIPGLHGYYPQTEIIDGRAFILAGDFDAATTTVYELLASGTVVERFTVEGDVFKWIRVR